MEGLTPKQEKFCTLYVELATHAYLQAYQTANMTHRTAQKRAGELRERGSGGAHRRPAGGCAEGRIDPPVGP